MITETTCYKCTCAKCGHKWTAKIGALPETCSKCKTKKWNSDYNLNQSTVIPPDGAEFLRKADKSQDWGA